MEILVHGFGGKMFSKFFIKIKNIVLLPLIKEDLVKVHIKIQYKDSIYMPKI